MKLLIESSPDFVLESEFSEIVSRETIYSHVRIAGLQRSVARVNSYNNFNVGNMLVSDEYC